MTNKHWSKSSHFYPPRLHWPQLITLLSDLSLDGFFGFALQVGADYEINDKWYVNASARYIDINTKASVAVGGDRIGAADISVDSMVYSLMLGYKI